MADEATITPEGASALARWAGLRETLPADRLAQVRLEREEDLARRRRVAGTQLREQLVQGLIHEQSGAGGRSRTG